MTNEPQSPQSPQQSSPPQSDPIRGDLTHPSYLPIPLDAGAAQIPKGMTEDDFELLVQTLQLWKKKLTQ